MNAQLSPMERKNVTALVKGMTRDEQMEAVRAIAPDVLYEHIGRIFEENMAYKEHATRVFRFANRKE